jgi:crotonobetainyl-CoA:carnitine CoA-transferase CaiB-like acyl-CoA transferase
MQRPDLIDDPRFALDVERVKYQSELNGIINQWLATFSDVSAAVAVLEEHNVPCAPVLSVNETLKHPHFLQRGTVRTVDDPIAGSFQIPGMPIKTSDYPADLPFVAPTLGEHNQEILRDVLGKSAEEIDAYVDDSVLIAGEY